jgi:hypothetical protein
MAGTGFTAFAGRGRLMVSIGAADVDVRGRQASPPSFNAQ